MITASGHNGTKAFGSAIVNQLDDIAAHHRFAAGEYQDAFGISRQSVNDFFAGGRIQRVGRRRIGSRGTAVTAPKNTAIGHFKSDNAGLDY